VIRLEHGQPITFGKDGQYCVTHPPGAFGLKVRDTAEVDRGEIMAHDASVAEPDYAFALSRLPRADLRYTPIGVFRSVDRPSYDDLVRAQVDTAKSKLAGDAEQELAALLSAGDTWRI
jgi:2-oxoglutarate ferredoxin oxidoreductase subunit beta